MSLLIFLFIRLPHVIDGPVRAWTAVNGECIFETLRAMFPHGPQTEDDVADFAARLEALYERLHALYPANPGEGAGGRGEDQGRLERQAAADAEDRAHEAADADGGPARGSEIADRLLDEAVRLEAGRVKGAEEMLEAPPRSRRARTRKRTG